MAKLRPLQAPYTRSNAAIFPRKTQSIVLLFLGFLFGMTLIYQIRKLFSVMDDMSLEKTKTNFDGVGLDLPLEASLEERLLEWQIAPRVEPANWVATNIETCPGYKITPNQNRQQLDQSHLLWASLNSTALYGLRDSIIEYLRRAKTEGKLDLDKVGQGKGLVFTAGNADTFSRVLLTLKMLHHRLSSPLESEIFSFPGEEPTEDIKTQLEQLGATFRTVKTASRDPKRVKNYHIKATAILQSRFREVLYLDSDNIPAGGLFPLPSNNNRTIPEQPGDQSGIWEAKGYKRLGVMFWPDYWKTSADNPIWAIIGVPCRDEWEQEAGQILIDKKYHLDALLLSDFLMDSSRFKFWFNFSDGDKDIFRYAFLALRKRWAVPGRYVGGGMFPRPTASGMCAHTMLQHDHRGRPLFVHQNLLKQIPSGIGKGFAWGLTRTAPVFGNLLKWEDRFVQDDDLEDFDVDCDMLANAGNDGRAIKSAPPAVRKRAVFERGIRTFFHGGSISALCVDMRWEDPRTPEELLHAKSIAAGKPPENIKETDRIDVSFTASDDNLEIKFRNHFQLVRWKHDVRLRDFESNFFDEGGKLNGQGFV